MKKYMIMSLMFLTGMFLTEQTLWAQVSHNHNYKQINIHQNGDVIDHEGTKIGYITKGDSVYNHEGKVLGYLKKGKAFDGNGIMIGKSKKGGSFTDAKGRVILQVKTDGESCEVHDIKGNKMLTAHKDYKHQACAIHCFFKSQE
jgi:hypothetical protein